jgi:hypothetical protein
MPKYHCLPFLVRCISGSRASFGRRRIDDPRLRKDRIDNRAGGHLQLPASQYRALQSQVQRGATAVRKRHWTTRSRARRSISRSKKNRLRLRGTTSHEEHIPDAAGLRVSNLTGQAVAAPHRRRGRRPQRDGERLARWPGIKEIIAGPADIRLSAGSCPDPATTPEQERPPVNNKRVYRVITARVAAPAPQRHRRQAADWSSIALIAAQVQRADGAGRDRQRSFLSVDRMAAPCPWRRSGQSLLATRSAGTRSI